MKTWIAVFSDREDANNAITTLEKDGYNPKDISIVAKDNESLRGVDTGDANVASGAAAGATTGGVIGGLAGLLVGLGAIALPGGLGALLIGGPIASALGLTGAAATTVTGAATGALAGGIVGALTKIGVPEEDARVYESRVSEGAILLAVASRSSEDDDQVKRIFEENDADQIRSVNEFTNR